MEERDEGAAASEPDGGLAGGVAASDDRDARGAAQLRLRRAGGVEDTRAFVLGELVEGEPPIGGAGREHDGSCGDLVVLLESNDVSSVAGLERDRAEGSRGSRAELARLADGPARQLGAADPRR